MSPGAPPSCETAIMQRLASCPILANAGHEALNVLASQARLVRLKARQHLFHTGDQAHHFFFVHSGSIALYRPSYNGDNKIFRIMEAGDLLAEACMFINPAHYPLSARACCASSVYRIPREPLLLLVRKSADFCYAMLEGMARRISQTLNRIDLLTTSNSSQRMVTYLMDLYMQQRSAWLTLPANQNVVARQLNIAPETFSRLLNSFKRAGLIAGRNREVTLIDVQGLCAAVDLPPPKARFGARKTDTDPHICPMQLNCNYARQPLGELSI